MQLQHVVGIILLKCLKEALMERGQQMIVISRRGMGIVVPIARVLLLPGRLSFLKMLRRN